MNAAQLWRGGTHVVGRRRGVGRMYTTCRKEGDKQQMGLLQKKKKRNSGEGKYDERFSLFSSFNSI